METAAGEEEEDKNQVDVKAMGNFETCRFLGICRVTVHAQGRLEMAWITHL